MKSPLRSLSFMLVIATVILVSMPAQSQVGGAIYTSTFSGITVNGNIYSLKSDVYLSGGPQNQNGSGLTPDGIYYFQVTDPSGDTLLSTDDVHCRQVTVASGRITGVPSLADPTCTTSGGAFHALGTFNGSNGQHVVQLIPFNDTPNPGGEYKVWVTPVNTYDPSQADDCHGAGYCHGFPNSSSKTDNFKVRERDDCVTDPTLPGCNLSNITTIAGTKYYDANANGQRDPGEVGIPNWLIQIDPASDYSSATCAYTNNAGNYGFTVFISGQIYTLSESHPNETNWFQTAPAPVPPGTGTAAATDPAINAGPDFGNVCIGTQGGLTLGFWSNKNGQALITASDLSTLVGLSLVDDKGKAFDPTKASQVSTWLLNANATNMAYMLSAQLATMKLNVLHSSVSKVDGSALVYAGAVPNGCSLTTTNGFVSINALMADANSLLGQAGGNLTIQASTQRTCEEFDKTLLDKSNNNLAIYVQPTACTHTFTVPSACVFEP